MFIYGSAFFSALQTDFTSPLPPHCLQGYTDAADRPCNMRWSQRPYLDLTHIQTILGNSNSNTKLGVNNIKSGTCEVEGWTGTR